MKWYAAMMIVFFIMLGLEETIKNGPGHCADACKANGRVMQSYGVVAGCVCADSKDRQ